jgi:hypothetical protein
MTVLRPGRAVDLIADKLLTHAAPHYQGGLVGIVQKQDEPGSFDSIASRTQVQAGIKYVLEVKGDVEVNALAGAVVGAPVYISTVDDSLSLVDDANHVPFGRVSAVAGTFGLPAARMRVDLDLKDNVANA